MFAGADGISTDAVMKAISQRSVAGAHVQHTPPPPHRQVPTGLISFTANAKETSILRHDTHSLTGTIVLCQVDRGRVSCSEALCMPNKEQSPSVVGF